MNHNTKSDKFIFNFPTEFVPEEINDKYMIFLDNTHKNYDNVLDYLNSTIFDITIPGMTLPTVEQTKMYGKKRNFRGATSPYDLHSPELNVNLKNSDFLMAYMIIKKTPFLSQFTVTTLDDEDREMFKLFFKELTATSQSDTRLGYQLKEENTETYTVSFMYNFFDIEFIPRYDEGGATGELLEEYYDRIIVNDPDVDPTKNYPANTGCDDDDDDDETFDENHPIIKKPD
jgi:hypothetical protein